MDDEYVLDTPVVRSFIDSVRAAIDLAGLPADAIERIRPRFADLLADPVWLPAAYQEPARESGMGGGTNDTGCAWRHAYDPDSGEQRPFRSGYVNVPCGDDEEAAPAS